MSQSIDPNDGRSPRGSGGQRSEAPEVVRAATVRMLRERISLLGVERSGAYEHYKTLLDQGFPIPQYEIEILNIVKQQLSDLRSYHEIGSGLGTLPLMLAFDGFPSVGVERDDRRHLTASTVLRDLAAKYPHVESNCRLFGASFPEAVEDLDVSDSMAILTDFVSTRSRQEYVRLCRGLAQYRYIIMDLQRFCTKREGETPQRQLIEELAEYGLFPLPVTLDFDSAGFYQLFESRPAQEQRPMTESSNNLVATAARSVAEEPRAKEVQPATGDARRDLSVVPSDQLPAQAEVRAQPAALSRFVLPPLPGKARHPRFGGLLTLSALIVIGLPTLLAGLYYGLWASNEYVTTFQFAVRGPSASATMRPGGASLSGGAGAMTPDAFIISDYINSAQAVSDVQTMTDVKAMFSKPTIDSWSRLPANASAEEFKDYWNRLVWAHFDIVSGNVSVSVRAFTPQDSLNLSRTIINASNDMFRRINAQGQRDFVKAADEHLARSEQYLAKIRQNMVAFREKSGLIDPDKTAQAGSAIDDELRRQLATLQTQYATLRATSPKSPGLATLRSQITGLEAQIRNEDQRGQSGVKAVTPEVLAQYQALDLERQFAEKQYTEALGMRSQSYLVAQNQQSFLALFVEPTLPQSAQYPRRLKSVLTVFLAAAAAWFAGMMITYAVRDHMM